ncbi:MAG: hypothetical protein HKN80_14025 [Acidimicrobiia bacterium]|nr:hypothetical protein [Acidimicrobiia bacterium]
MVHSFDVFDTCLVRVFLRPTDLFYELANRMLDEVRGPDGFGAEEISELARARIEAESRAEKAATSQDVTLAEIYDRFHDLAGWDIDPDRMLHREIELEIESVRPVSVIKQRIEQLRADGGRIVFASDMYLPEDVIRRMLVSAGIAEPTDPLYVSSAEGVTKRTGDLFRLIMSRESISPAELTHVGDSLLGEFVPARRLGIRAELFTDAHPNRYERAIADQASPRPWVAARIAGVSRATRLTHVPENEAVIPGMGAVSANVVAPMLTGFVVWALQEAALRNLNRLYFVARDGQVLMHIAERLAEHVPTPALRYLYGSRRAWYLPSVQDLIREDLGFAVLEGQSRAPRAMLAKLGLTPEQIEEELAAHGFEAAAWDDQLDADDVDRFWDVLTSPVVGARILEAARQAREVAVAYFRQEGLLDDARWALVDVGWTLRTQASLTKMLKAAGQEHVDGYYLGITELRFSATEYGRAQGFFVEEVEDRLRPSATPIFENKGFVDDILIQADHGQTFGYARNGERVEPVLGPVDGAAERAAMLGVLQATATGFAAELAAAGLTGEVAALKQAARLTTEMFFGRPTREDVRAVAWASLTPDPDKDRIVPLVRKLSLLALVRIARDLLRRSRRAPQASDDGKTVPRVFYKDAAWGFSWLEGSVAISGPSAKLALWAFRTMRRAQRNRRSLLAAFVRKLDPLFRRMGRS